MINRSYSSFLADLIDRTLDELPDVQQRERFAPSLTDYLFLFHALGPFRTGSGIEEDFSFFTGMRTSGIQRKPKIIRDQAWLPSTLGETANGM